MKLFTYGTLRRGERNHWTLQGDFIADDTIAAQPAGMWGTDIPLIREGEGTISGEVYEVDDRALWILDRFENTADGVYERRKVLTHSGIEAWVYFPGADLLRPTLDEIVEEFGM